MTAGAFQDAHSSSHRADAAHPLISAHRGNCGLERWPLAQSYERAIRLGVDYVEFDVRTTRDAVLVVHHDRVTPGGTEIGSLSWKEYAAEMGADALTVLELLELAAGRVRLHVDLKEIGSERAALEMVLMHAAASSFVITTLEDVSALFVKNTYPDVRVGLSLGRGMEGERPWRTAAVRVSEVYPGARVAAGRPDFLAVHQRLARLRLLRFCAARSLPAWIWTVDDPVSLATFAHDPRVEAVITNRPDLALAIRAGTELSSLGAGLADPFRTSE